MCVAKIGVCMRIVVSRGYLYTYLVCMYEARFGRVLSGMDGWDRMGWDGSKVSCAFLWVVNSILLQQSTTSLQVTCMLRTGEQLI